MLCEHMLYYVYDFIVYLSGCPIPNVVFLLAFLVFLMLHL